MENTVGKKVFKEGKAESDAIKNKPSNPEKHNYLNPKKPPGCVRYKVEQGMNHKEAVIECNELWKKEEERRDEQRIFNV